MIIKLGIIPFKKTVVELYDTVKDMPVHRYNELNKLACIDMGVGSQMSDFAAHFTKLHAYLKNNKVDEAVQETKNLHNNFFYMVEKIGVWSYSFAVMIKAIDGVPYEGTELPQHYEMMDTLSKKGLTAGQCEDAISEVKKNLSRNLNGIFLVGLKAESPQMSLPN